VLLRLFLKYDETVSEFAFEFNLRPYIEDGVVHANQATSQFKGVRWDKSSGKWAASCKGKYLGTHATQEAAARVYADYVKDGIDPVRRQAGTSSKSKGVTWIKRSGKWKAVCEGKALGHHATEEAAAQAYNSYVEDGVVLVTQRGTSQFKGVTWDKSRGKWAAWCKGKRLGHHATEEAAARAYDDYVKNGVDPVQRRGTSQFKGVSWYKSSGKWVAICKGKRLGYHVTEEVAAQAYNIEAERLGLPLNVIPPAGDADDGNAVAPAALALAGTAASAHTHAGAGSKRSKPASASTSTAPPQRKKKRLDASAAAAAGEFVGGLVVAAHGQH